MAVMMKIAGVILAAGKASRMGSNKLVEDYQGKALVRHVAEAALEAGLSPLIVVTGHYPDPVQAALSGMDVDFIHNPDYSDGLTTSLQEGISAVPAECSGALILLGDMPLVSSRAIRQIMDAFANESDKSAAVPVIAGQRGNPVLLDRRIFTRVMQLSGDTGARALLAKADLDVLEVSVEDAGILLDVDTPEALAALRNR